MHCSNEISITADVLTRQYALSNNLSLGDAFIAATALHHHETLCTANPSLPGFAGIHSDSTVFCRVHRRKWLILLYAAGYPANVVP
jgi:predicted nucleic acid-binding protein